VVALVLAGACRFDRSGLTAGDTSDGRAPVDLASSELGAGDGPRDATADRVEAGLEVSVPDLPVADLAPTCPLPCPGAAICCDKGSGPMCYAPDDTEDCPCDIATGFPCAGTAASICCDRGEGPTCSDSFWFGGRCKCIPATGAPCAGDYPVCCDKGSGHRCFKDNDTEDCACNLTSKQPCGSNDPICCDKGAGPRCTSSYTWSDRCKCTPVTAAPCGGNYPVCCDKGAGAGFRCYSENETKDCACAPSTQKPCAGTSYPSCCDVGGGLFRCQNSC
jgi:hypothetical protein